MTGTWKSCERRIAKILGCKRHPVNGRGDEPDLSNDWLVVEVKHRASLPAWLHKAMAQAERNAQAGSACRQGDRLPEVVLHEDGQRYADAFVVLRLADFADRRPGWDG
jgi:hypothetical protein